MGVNINVKSDVIELIISSNGGSIHQSRNILKMIKASKKPVKVNIDSVISSMSSMICMDIDKMAKKITEYKYYPEQMFTAIPRTKFFP